MVRERGRGRRRTYEYVPQDASTITKRSEQGGGNRDGCLISGTQQFKARKGSNRIRILPPTWTLPEGINRYEHYGVDVWVHFQIGADNHQYICAKAMVQVHETYGFSPIEDVRCPIDDERDDASGAGDDKYASSLKAKRRVVVALIDRDDEKIGVQYWAMPWTVDKDISLRRVDKRTGETYNIDDPDKGYDIDFEYTPPAGQQPGKYEAIALARRDSPLGNDTWLNDLMDKPIPDVLQYHDYDYIAKIFAGKKSSIDTPSGEQQSSGDQRDNLAALTYDDIQGMSGRDLEDLAINDLKFTERELPASDDALKDEICKELRLEKPHDVDNASASSRLSGLRDKYKK